MSARANHAELPRSRTVARAAYGAAILLGFIALLAAASNFASPRGNDFISFWAAGKLVLAGEAASAYDIGVHARAEASGVPGYKATNPFPYPPPFLFMVAPFAAFPPPIAQLVWILVTGLLFWWRVRPWVPMRLFLSHPPNLITAIVGQSSFLTGAMIAGGISLVSRHPWLSGVILGGTVIKPQLALLVPVALIAGGHWRTLLGAAASAIALLGASLLLFGSAAFSGFLAILPFYSDALEAAKWPWTKFGSLYALVRQMGAGQGVALAVHAVPAVLAAIATFVAWRRDAPAKMPILLTGCLLVSPYLLTYDLALLVVATSWLSRSERRSGGIILIWLLLALPMLSYVEVPNVPATAALGAILALGLLLRADPDLSRDSR
jgi:alpha-1,2-mannosyltransferase